MIQSMTPEEREAFLNSVAYGSTTDNNVQVSGYYDNNMAQEVFNLTNQERANKFNRGCPKRKKVLQSLSYRYLQRGYDLLLDLLDSPY